MEASNMLLNWCWICPEKVLSFGRSIWVGILPRKLLHRFVVGADGGDGVLPKTDNIAVYVEQGLREANRQFIHRYKSRVWTCTLHDHVPDAPRKGSCTHQGLWRRTCLLSAWSWHRLSLSHVEVGLIWNDFTINYCPCLPILVIFWVLSGFWFQYKVHVAYKRPMDTRCIQTGCCLEACVLLLVLWVDHEYLWRNL